MKTKSFQNYLKKRLSKEEIAEIKAQAELEVRMLKSIQKVIKKPYDIHAQFSKIDDKETLKKYWQQ